MTVAPLRSAVSIASLTRSGGTFTSIRLCPSSGKNASSITNDAIAFSIFSAIPDTTIPP